MTNSASLADRFDAAATALVAGNGLVGLHPDEVGLLRYLMYDDGNLAAAAARARILRAAGKLQRLLLLPVPDAPGLTFFGAEANPAGLDPALHGVPLGSMAGSGVTPQRAFESCVGEAIEFLSQFVRSTDRIEFDTIAGREAGLDPAGRDFVAAVIGACGVDPARPIGWVAVQPIGGGAQSWYPVDLCLRRPVGQADFAPPLKLSSGCAAGVTTEAAALRAMLELIERDAAALWWRGGRRGRAIRPDSAAGTAAAALLRQLRGGKDNRRTWLLDITTDLGVPAVAAASCNADGFGFAFGLGSRPSLAEAAAAAIFELCQLELGVHLAAAKRRDGGEAALTEVDRHHLQRSTVLDTAACLLLQPEGDSDDTPSGIPADPADALLCIVARLESRGIRAYRLDLTRPAFAVPVIRVLAPGLQLEPCAIIGERLARAIAETGGGAVHTAGLSLL